MTRRYLLEYQHQGGWWRSEKPTIRWKFSLIAKTDFATMKQTSVFLFPALPDLQALLNMFVGKPTRLERLVRTSLRLIAAAILLPLCGAEIANASCGDYVMVGGHGQAAPGHSLPGVPKCHGPNCQRQSPLPVLPTKGLLNAPPADSACLSSLDGSSSPPLFAEIFERRRTPAKGHSLLLLRPPCL